METPKTAAQRGVRTFWQATGAIIVGLALTVWNVPGVPEAVVAYAQQNILPLFFSFVLTIGVPAGVIAWIQNKIEGNK